MTLSKNTKIALIVGGIAILGVGTYFLGKSKGWWGNAAV